MKTNMKRKNANRTKADAREIGDDLIVARKTRRLSAAGTWVTGNVLQHI